MTTRERRLRAEWAGLQQLATANPKRLSALVWDDAAMTLQLHEAPALAIGCADAVVRSHQLTFAFPTLVPAMPMNLSIEIPVLHPNIHPETGFVCLWETHRVGHTVEQAVHKLVAMLSGQLMNAEAVHVMQLEALARFTDGGVALRARLEAAPLVATGLSWPQADERPSIRRRRLS